VKLFQLEYSDGRCTHKNSVSSVYAQAAFCIHITHITTGVSENQRVHTGFLPAGLETVFIYKFVLKNDNLYAKCFETISQKVEFCILLSKLISKCSGIFPFKKETSL
jgi:hypothetical protein